MPSLSSVVLTVHVVGALVWVIGTLLLGFAAAWWHRTATVDGEARRARDRRVARLFAYVLWPDLGVTLITGAYNLTWFLPPPAGALPWFAGKLALVALMIGTSVVHHRVAAPGLREAREAEDAEGANRWARRTRLLAFVAVLSGLCAILFAVKMASY